MMIVPLGEGRWMVERSKWKLFLVLALAVELGGILYW